MDILDDDSRAVLLAALESCAQSASAGPGGPYPAPATPIPDEVIDFPYRPPDLAEAAEEFDALFDHVADTDVADDIMDDAESCYDDCLPMDDILSQCSHRESSAASDVAPMDLDPESDSDNMPLDADPSGGDSWTPGENVEPWITQNRPADKQAQVLIVNLLRSAQRLSTKAAKYVMSQIMPEALIQKVKATRKSSHIQLVAGLVRMSASGVASIVENVRAAGWQPYAPKDKGKVSGPLRGGEEAAACPPVGEDCDVAIKNIVRVALAAAVEGRSFQEYVRDLQRFRLASADVGNKHMDSRFAREVVAIASMIQQQIDALDWNSSLPGLGIPSDVGILSDPVSLGLSVRAKHDVLMVMCVSAVSHRTGQHVSSMHSAPTMQLGGHTGPAMAEAILSSLALHPAAWGVHALRARCSAVSGDGQLCAGGPEHRHSSTAAAERIWHHLHPRDSGVATCTVWDPFHRADNAAMRAIRAVPYATQMFDLAKTLENMFGMSEGLTIFRATAAHIGEKPRAIKAPGGTRKIVYLSGTPFSILENFHVIQASLHARAKSAQEGSGTYTIADVLAVGRDLQEVSFVVFLLAFHDVLVGVFKPFAVLVQGSTEPSMLFAAQRRLVSGLKEAELCIRLMRKLLLVVTLCRQHAGAEDLSNLILAHAATRAGRYFPQFFKNISQILLSDPGPPTFKRCILEVKGNRAVCGSDSQCLGPHCQCLAREDSRGVGEAGGQGRVAGGQGMGSGEGAGEGARKAEGRGQGRGRGRGGRGVPPRNIGGQLRSPRGRRS
jgi:hypothetical protein